MTYQNVNAGRYFLLSLFLIFAVIVADQFSKWLVMETLLRVADTHPPFIDWFFSLKRFNPLAITGDEFRSVAVAPWLNLVMVWNHGISFGLLDTQDPRMAFVFIGVSLLIVMLLLVWMVMTKRFNVAVALALAIGGAIGNVIDRVRFAAVADFLDAHLGDLHWPAFNFADSCIVIGAVYLMLDSVLAGKEKA
jgi:signal peptidase II